MMTLLLYEVFVFPFLHTFYTDDLSDSGIADFAKRSLPPIFTLVFVFDVVFISWRTIDQKGIEDATALELIKMYLSSPWAIVDVLGALPWDLLPQHSLQTTPFLRLMRMGRARIVVP